MFELNLIKDKAMARQRRRIIFMSVVSILFLALLSGMGVGSLFWTEKINLDKLTSTTHSLVESNAQREAILTVEWPKTLRRRNALIRALNEDRALLQDRRLFAPALKDIYERRPATAEFWYSQLKITAESPDGEGAALMAPRKVRGFGHIQLELSDVRTQEELSGLSPTGGTRSMVGVTQLAGNPLFTMQGSDPMGTAARQGDERRYVGFDMRAEQRTFTGYTGGQ